MDKELLIPSLIERGWYSCDHFIDDSLCRDLINEMHSLPLRPAKIGKGQAEQRASEIRNDSIFWLTEQQGIASDRYLKKANDLIDILNRELYLGLKQFEGHFARYDQNGFYKKHLDQFVGNSERLVSLITYLNTPASGGKLRIYKKENPEEIELDLAPIAGRMVCFLSNQIYHEVMPTNSERYSVTGWLRTTIL